MLQCSMVLQWRGGPMAGLVKVFGLYMVIASIAIAMSLSWIP
jgi:hypothetical protein